MPTNNTNPKSKKNQLNDYLRYSGMGFQMAAIIFVCTWGGKMIDKALDMKTPVFTLVLSLLSVVLSMYYFIKGIGKKE